MDIEKLNKKMEDECKSEREDELALVASFALVGIPHSPSVLGSDLSQSRHFRYSQWIIALKTVHTTGPMARYCKQRFSCQRAVPLAHQWRRVNM